MEPEEVVEEIRRTQFLIGVALPPDAEQGARNIRATLNRTLQILSEDLYSTETHFILELIQNADDNAYASAVKPEIVFLLEPERLTINNNESGFSAENVRALCNAGHSTKSKREGFIGEKGIGFKSVFAVSDRPEIHSGGFHFHFEAGGENLLGYVVPTWIPGQPDESGTRIVLPARNGGHFEWDALADVSPELLLFLRKLRRLRVHDHATGAALEFERFDEDGRVSLRTTSTPDILQTPQLIRERISARRILSRLPTSRKGVGLASKRPRSFSLSRSIATVRRE